jgi:hypothetical protein
MNANYYTEQEVAQLLGLDKMTIAQKYRKRLQTKKVSNRHYYDRHNVDTFIENELSGQDILIAEKQRQQFDFVNIDLMQYLPLCDMLEIVPVSRQRVYQKVNDGDIEIKMFDGFKMFSKKDVLELWPNET